MTALIRTPGHPLRSRIKSPDPPIHQLRDPATRERIPPRRHRRQLGIDRGQHLLIGDQSGPKDHHRNHLEIHLTGRHRRTQLRQPLHQLHAVIHVRRSPRPTDAQLRGHLSSHRLPVIDAPLRALVLLHISHPHLTQPARRQQPPRHRHPLHTQRISHLRQQRRLIT